MDGVELANTKVVDVVLVELDCLTSGLSALEIVEVVDIKLLAIEVEALTQTLAMLEQVLVVFDITEAP